MKWYQDYAIKDDLVTPPCATAGNRFLEGTDVVESVAFHGGHVAILTSPYAKKAPVNGEFVDGIGKKARGPVKFMLDMAAGVISALSRPEIAGHLRVPCFFGGFASENRYKSRSIRTASVGRGLGQTSASRQGPCRPATGTPGVSRPEPNSEENKHGLERTNQRDHEDVGGSAEAALERLDDLGSGRQPGSGRADVRSDADVPHGSRYLVGLREGPAQRLAGNIFGTPDVMTRSMNMLMQAWQMVAPKIEQGKTWQPDLQKLLDQWRQEMSSLPKRGASMGGDFAQLSKTLFERWTPMTAPWLSMLGQATAGGHPGAAFLGGTAGANQMFNFQDMLQGPFAQLNIGELPRATVVREKMGTFLKVFDALSDLQEAQSEYQKSLSEGLAQSVERTIEHLAKLAEKGEKITSARDLMRTWYSIADRTLMEMFNTEGVPRRPEQADRRADEPQEGATRGARGRLCGDGDPDAQRDRRSVPGHPRAEEGDPVR